MRLLATRPLKCNAVKAQKCQHGTDQAQPVSMPHKRRSRGLAKTYLVGEGASPQAPAEHRTVLGKNRTLASSWRRSARTAAYTYSRAQTEGEMHHIW